MMHANHLFRLPQDRKVDASSLRQLINHLSCQMKAQQPLSLNVSVQDMMLNSLI